MSKRPPFARCGCHISSPFTEAPPSRNESSLPLLSPWVLAKVSPVLSGDADSPLPSPRRDWAKIPPCSPPAAGSWTAAVIGRLRNTNYIRCYFKLNAFLLFFLPELFIAYQIINYLKFILYRGTIKRLADFISRSQAILLQVYHCLVKVIPPTSGRDILPQ